MDEPILVINAGSSSIKFSLFEAAGSGRLDQRACGQVSGIGVGGREEAGRPGGAGPWLEITDGAGTRLEAHAVAAADHTQGFALIQQWLTGRLGSDRALSGVGHRVVHGGSRYREPVRIDAAVLATLESLVPLAPLHQPHHIAAIRAVSAAAPAVPQVACFDTAFHTSQPPLAQRFALPRALGTHGLHRYGFHGLSCEYVIGALPAIAPECAAGRLVIAHLGNGASMTAVHRGRSLANTMGFTPLDGLPMGTRCGNLDPGVILYLLQHEHMSADAIEQLLYERSGLLGLSGVSSDMRSLLASERPEARDAVDLFVYRVGRELGSLAAALGGLDGLIFTGGIGEHAAPVRAAVLRQARWLGLELDAEANERGGPQLTSSGSPASAWVVHTDEDLMVARHTRRLLQA